MDPQPTDPQPKDPEPADPQPRRRPSPNVSRRDLLVGGAVGVVAGAAVTGTAWAVAESGDDPKGTAGGDEAEAAAPSTPEPPPMRRFHSTQLAAVDVEVTGGAGAAAAGVTLVTPRVPAFRGMIYDLEG